MYHFVHKLPYRRDLGIGEASTWNLFAVIQVGEEVWKDYIRT